MPSKQAAMATCAGQGKNEDIILDAVNKEPIRSDVTLAMSRKISSQRMVAANGRERNTLR